MFPLRDSYASAARAALEVRLANVHPDRLPAVLDDPEVRDLIQQASELPPTPPAAFSNEVDRNARSLTIRKQMATNTANATRRLMTPQEAADELRVSKHTIYSMANSGTVPAIRVGSQLRIPADELETWITKNRWFSGGKEG